MQPEHLAQIRDRYDRGIDDTIELALDCLGNGINVLDYRTKGRDNWIADLKRYQADHVAMLAHIGELLTETERLTTQRNNAHRALLTAEAQRDSAYKSIRLIAESLGRLAAFQLANNPDDTAWNIVNTSALALITAAPNGNPDTTERH